MRVVLCRVCGRNLGVRGWIRGLLRPAGYGYPVRRVDGSRAERRIRWICYRCELRGDRIRTAGDLENDLDREVTRRKLLKR